MTIGVLERQLFLEINVYDFHIMPVCEWYTFAYECFERYHEVG